MGIPASLRWAREHYAPRLIQVAVNRHHWLNVDPEHQYVADPDLTPVNHQEQFVAEVIVVGDVYTSLRTKSKHHKRAYSIGEALRVVHQQERVDPEILRVLRELVAPDMAAGALALADY